MRRTHLVAALVASAALPALSEESGWADQAPGRAKAAAAAVTARETARGPARNGGLTEQAKDAVGRVKSR